MIAATPKISVIIPHLNQHEHLHLCLASLKEQSFDLEDVEIIVVDNGSKQLPSDVCSAFGARLEQEQVPGPGPARNKGVAVSCASVLAFIDADCLADKDWLKMIAKTLLQDKSVQVLGGDVRIAYEDPSNLTMLEAYESIYAYRQQDYIERQGFSGTGNLAMQRSVYDAVGHFAGISIAEDRDWGHRATENGYTIAYIPEIIVAHPARKNMGELFVKWDRHVAHDFEEYSKGQMGRLYWLALIVAVAGSPVFELWRIARSTRVTSFRQRLLAAQALVVVRLYRARHMTELLFKGQKLARSGKWNR